MHRIVVLNDGETWTEAEGCLLMEVTDAQFEDLQNGVKPSWLEEVVGVLSLSEMKPEEA